MSDLDPRDACARPDRFPARIDNRPGLSHLDRRIGTYRDVRAMLLERLDREPALARWTHRGADDPGIALLEGTALVADVLTFYQELYANEAYLSTAAWRESIAALVRLVGYRLAPGIGGRATVALEVRGERPVEVPAGFPLVAPLAGSETPVDFQTTTPLTALPALSRFPLSRPLTTPDVTTATRELVVAEGPHDLDLRAGQRLLVGSGGSDSDWDRAEIAVIDAVRERHGQTVVTLRGALWATTPAHALVALRVGRTWRHFGHAAPPTVTRVTAGTASTDDVETYRSLDGDTRGTDATPFIPAHDVPLDPAVPDLAPGTTVVCQVAPEPLRTHGSWAGGRTLERMSAARERAMGAATAASNAGAARMQMRRASTSTGFGVLDGAAFDAVQSVAHELAQAPAARNPRNRFVGGEIEIRINGLEPCVAIRRVRTVRQTTLAWGALTGPTTVVTLDGVISDASGAVADIRTISVHEATSPMLRLTALPEPTPVERGQELGFTGTAEEAAALAGRRILLVAPGAEPVTASVVRVDAPAAPLDARRLRTIALDTRVDYAGFDPDRPLVAAYGNVVDASQGRSEREEPIGSGDARAVFQTMPLPKGPLTFLTVPGSTPPETPELEVFVAGRRWTRVASLFGQAARAEVYVVITDDDGRSWVAFGDGRTGARLPSGVDNVVVRYRTGAGAFGPLRDGASVKAGARLDGLETVTMPGVASGGSAPEAAARARVAAPGTVQSLGRLVSLADFETEARSIGGVIRARAAWRLVDNVPSTVVTVLLAAGRTAEFATVRDAIATADRRRGAARFPVIVAEGRLRAVTAVLHVVLDEAVHEADTVLAIRRALRAGGIDEDEDGTGGRSFGERVFASRLESAAQGVDGVQWARIDDLSFTPGPAAVAWRMDRVVRRTLVRGVLRSELPHWRLLPGGPRVLRPAGVAGFPAPGGAPERTRVIVPGPDEILALDTAALTITVAVAGAREGIR